MVMGDSFDAGAEYHCPCCDRYFGFRAYPTFDEVRTDPRADPIGRIALAVAEARMRAGPAGE
jgi:hypothetical protein